MAVFTTAAEENTTTEWRRQAGRQAGQDEAANQRRLRRQNFQNG